MHHNSTLYIIRTDIIHNKILLKAIKYRSRIQLRGNVISIRGAEALAPFGARPLVPQKLI